MWDQYWLDRGQPWEFDPGPTSTGGWAELFAETPNYRGIGTAWSGTDEFRWHFGPMFYRGRLKDGDAKVLVIGQEGAQDESLAHRSFTGGTGGRMQYVLSQLGITRSYLFLNTFVYPIFNQYDDGLRPLAQDARSPIVRHRHAILDLAADRHDLRLVIAVGTAAKESVATWIRAHGGTANPNKLHEADSDRIRSGLRTIGVLHPGGASKGGSLSTIVADFKAALHRIESWTTADPGWLPADSDGSRQPASAYKYRTAPIPFRDFAFGAAWRLGFGTTTSNRRDGQEAIQLFSDDGIYNNKGVTLTYPNLPAGSDDGYDAPSWRPRLRTSASGLRRVRSWTGGGDGEAAPGRGHRVPVARLRRPGPAGPPVVRVRTELPRPPQLTVDPRPRRSGVPRRPVPGPCLQRRSRPAAPVLPRGGGHRASLRRTAYPAGELTRRDAGQGPGAVDDPQLRAVYAKSSSGRSRRFSLASDRWRRGSSPTSRPTPRRP